MALLPRTSRPDIRSRFPRPPGAAPVRTYPVGTVVAPMGRPSDARAARGRAARRHEQAVSAWLRELSGRPR